MLSLLFTYQMRFARRFFEKDRTAKLLTVVGFFVAFLVLVAIVYESFYFGFKYIAKDIYFREAITIYIVELFFLVSFILIYASALMSGLFSMFRSTRDVVILASPQYGLKLSLVFIRMFFSSLWPLLAIILPALVAFHQIFGLPLIGLFLSTISSIAMIGVANMFAIVTLLLVGVILDVINFFTLQRVITVSIALFAGLVLLVWGRFRTLNLVDFFQARMLTNELPDLAPILAQFTLFPSHFSALTVFYAQIGQYSNAVFALLYTVAIFLLFTISFFSLKKEYLGLWQRGQEGMLHMSSHLSLLSTAMLRTPSPVRAMLAKEAITFLRNGRGMLWVGFILLIWLFQSASSRILSHGLATDRIMNGDVPSAVSSLQVSVILYFVAMFVLRFAFPSFSAEQKSMWAIRSSPVNMDSVYAVKLLFFTLLFSLIAVTFTVGSALSLGLILPLSIPLIFVVLLGTFSLTTFGLSLGALFPNTETDDPERLSTTLPGIGFIIGAICYGLFAAIALRRYLEINDLLTFSVFITFSLLATLFLVSRVHRIFHNSNALLV